MKTANITISLALFLLLTTHALANDKAIEQIAREDNISIAEVKEILETGCESPNTAIMTQCSCYHYRIADFELNEVYNQLKKKLTPADKTKLLAAQKAWIKYRDAACEYETAEWEGGTGHGVIQCHCMQNYTEERTKRLRGYLNKE